MYTKSESFQTGWRIEVEEKEFLNIIDTHKDTIYRIALNYLGNPFDADDIVQEVFIELYESGKTFDSDDHIRYWLVRVAINRCKNTLKSFWWRKRTPIEEVTKSVPFETKEQSELFAQVMGLPEKYRVVLYLFYYEEFSVKEIAELLHIKESAVTTRLARAREKLKSELKGVLQYEG